MALFKLIRVSFRRPSQSWRSCATLQHSKLVNQKNRCSAFTQQWHHKSCRNFANFAVSSSCSNKYNPTLTPVSHSKRCKFLQSDSTSSVQLWNPRRGVATEPSGYEYILASRPVHLAQTVFEQCHNLTGLPWWGTIILTTVGMRLILTLPLAVYSKHIAAKVEKLQPEIQTLAKHAFVRKYRHRALAEKWSQERIKKTVFYLVGILVKLSISLTVAGSEICGIIICKNLHIFLHSIHSVQFEIRCDVTSGRLHTSL